MRKVQHNGLKYAQGPEFMTVPSCPFPHSPHPNASISRESQLCWAEPSTLSWAQHNQGVGISMLAQVLTLNKSYPLAVCQLEKVVMAEAAFQSFLRSVNAF